MRVFIGAVLVSLLAALAVALFWRPLLHLFAESRIEALLGCAVRIGEPVGLSLASRVELRLPDVELSARKGSSQLCDARVSELSVVLVPARWPQGLPALDGIDARGGELRLSSADAGHEAMAILVKLEQLELVPVGDSQEFTATLSGQLVLDSLELPLRGSARLEISRAGAGVSGLDLHLGSRETAWLEASGSAGSLDPLRDFEFRADFGWADVRSLEPLVRSPPDIGPVTGSLTVHDPQGVVGITDFSLKGGRKGVFEVDAAGKFEDIANVHGLDTRLHLEAHNLAIIGELLRTSLPPIAPFSFKGQVKADGRHVSSTGVTARLGKTDVAGSFSAELPEAGRPRYEVELRSEHLHLADLGIAPKPRPAQKREASSWSDDPLVLDPLRDFDANFSARAEHVEGVSGPLLDHLSFEGELERGRLSVRHLMATYDGGQVKADLTLDSSVDPPAYTLKAEARSIEMSQLFEQIVHSSAYSGLLHGELELAASGTSLRRVVSGAHGRVTAMSPGGTIATEHATLLTKDFFSVLRPTKRRETEPLNCLVADFDVEGGIGTARTLVLDTKDLVVVGEGSANLGKRTFDLRFVPKPRDPSPFSTAATIHLTGPMGAPVVQAEKSSLLFSSTKAVLETLPWLSRTRGSLRRLVGIGTPFGHCDEILGAKP